MNNVSKKKIYFLFYGLLMLIGGPTLSYGASSQLWYILKSGRPVVAIGAGAAITSDLGASQSFPFNKPIVDTNFNYSVNGTTRVEPIFDIFLGEEWVIAYKWALQLGFGYDQTGPFQVNGAFTQGMLPRIAQINNDYRYDIRVRQVMVESKLAYLLRERYHPYVFLGLGAAINDATNYWAYVPFPSLTRQYKNDTTTSFTYSVGLGIDVDIVECTRLGIGYRFSDFGNAQLGQANIFGNGVSGTLSQSHLYASEVLAQLTFVI